MLKIMKYEVKRISSLLIYILFIVTVIFLSILITIKSNSNSLVIRSVSESYYFTNLASYLIAGIFIIGYMFYRTESCTELYEMAEITPLKVGLIRMGIVFLSIVIIASMLMVYESIIVFLSNYQTIDMSFSVIGQSKISILKPVFMGLYGSILYTTSFMTSTVNRRLIGKLASTFALGSMLVLIALVNFSLINNINMLTPALNLNKYGATGLIFEEYGLNYMSSYYQTIGYLINPNFLNVGFIIFQALFVCLMFSVYSMRRKVVWKF